MELNRCVARLIAYAKEKLDLGELDAIYCVNLLFKEWGIASPFEGDASLEEVKGMERPDLLWEELVLALKEKGMDDGKAEREAAFAFGILSPSPSRAADVFSRLHREESPSAATDYLYSLGIRNGYIALSKIEKNIVFPAVFPSSPSLEITVNLSKPEKSNKDIAKLLDKKENRDYPKCFLCKENLGYEGTSAHPARENLRFVPLDLDGERWYLQYSPYGYFDEHCIVFSAKHSQMSVSRRIFSKLFAFVDLFPHYFIGCNSDLPIVGGSILDHEHFQSGKHMLPLLKASPKKIVPTPNYSKTELSVLSLTITSLAKKEGDVYSLFLILRNNRTDRAYPDGVFHAHPEYFHVKKEGIGLIEAGGRFILPPRLIRQSQLIRDGLQLGLSDAEIVAKSPELSGFERMMDALRDGVSLQSYLGEVCRGILHNVAVYKDTPQGEKGLEEFLHSLSL